MDIRETEGQVLPGREDVLWGMRKCGEVTENNSRVVFGKEDVVRSILSRRKQTPIPWRHFCFQSAAAGVCISPRPRR